MSKVLLFSLGGQGCQEAGQLDEAIVQYESGNEVLVVYCDRYIGGCRDNPYFCGCNCKICESLQRHRAHKYFCNRSISFERLSSYINEEIQARLKSFHPEYDSIQTLKDLKYRGVEIGYGLLSSFISRTRDLNPEFTLALKEEFDKILNAEVLVTELLYEVVNKFHPDLMVVHNGRHWTYRPFVGVAIAQGINYICTEFLHMPDGSEGKNYYYNTIPHDKYANANKYLDFWDSINDEEYKTRIGKSFFERKKQNLFAGDTIYTAEQVKGLLPDSFDPSKKHVVIFNSSEDEMFSINKVVDEDNLFPNQVLGITKIVNHLESFDDVQVYLRVHPHLCGISYNYHTDLYQIKGNNFTAIPADSSISSYALLEIADTVIVFGSTIGVEASYWGKKVINLSCAFYDPLGIVYRPNTEEELWSYLDNSNVLPANNENAIKMGFYMMSYDHPQLQYVPLKTYRFSILGHRQEAHSYTTILGSSYIYWVLSKILYYSSYIGYKFKHKIGHNENNRSHINS